MKLTKCKEGHFYDGDTYEECPFCSSVININEPVDPIREEPIEPPQKIIWPIPLEIPFVCPNGHHYDSVANKHCPYCSISYSYDENVYIGDDSYSSGKNVLYLGVGKTGCQYLNSIERSLNNFNACFHYYDYSPDTFRCISMDYCTLLPQPVLPALNDLTDEELISINELCKKKMIKGFPGSADNSEGQELLSYAKRIFDDQKKTNDDLFQFRFLDVGEAGYLFQQQSFKHDKSPMDLVIVVSAYNVLDFYLALLIQGRVCEVGTKNSIPVHVIIAALSDEYEKGDDSVLQQEALKRQIRESVVLYELSACYYDESNADGSDAGGSDAKYLFVLPERTKDELVQYLPDKIGILKSINIAQKYFAKK